MGRFSSVKTAPVRAPEASVSMTKGLENSGNLSIWSDMMANFNSLNVGVAFLDNFNPFFLSISVNGLPF